MRFDEVELEPVPFAFETPVESDASATTTAAAAPRLKRLFALLVDLSLFVALSLALSPLLPGVFSWTAIVGLAGFVLVVSYYYFVVTWMLWGKTIGGEIFDVRVVAAESSAMSLRGASVRWAATLLSLLLGGIGFMLAALPSRLSLPDRLSSTRCVTG